MAQEKITGIVTDIVKHNDRSNVVTLFTRTRGRVAFISSAGGGRAGRQRNARLMPLSVIEADINFRENRSLQLLGAVSPAFIWKDIYFNPVKSAIAVFLTEFLNRYLRESAPEPLLWDYIVESLRNLDTRRNRTAANFHLSFLIGFLNFAGIAPDVSDYERGDWFDMVAGVAVADAPHHKSFLTPDEAALLPKLLRMNRCNDHLFRFSGRERRDLLDRLLQYYAVHFPGMANLRSPEILTEVFS